MNDELTTLSDDQIETSSEERSEWGVADVDADDTDADADTDDSDADTDAEDPS